MKVFFIKNWKIFFHILTLVLYFFLFEFIHDSLIGPELTPFREDLVMLITLVVSNFFINEYYSFKKSGLEDYFEEKIKELEDSE